MGMVTVFRFLTYPNVLQQIVCSISSVYCISIPMSPFTNMDQVQDK